ncbi:4-hydroxy-tetrahydrodipicolinate synthase [Paenalkalicoccus suaedae]|uniref:4-hydroxy-tetrahydrodipicolinate synthase n=1 Tax=Paenalkalicoccus suaedae TaxID=2592382 RepID=A0A859FG28_9BACI|nr:4-hydroxy-tetrahydrodipicolinate synthase [Paenalkalicoccus suaedae]QKS71186.1 4-hydroxy-tetrahydrodipicolinate synthase [Paenalkalicoccus suaedae]
MNFGQVITAMVTPFDESNHIDYAALRKLINHLIANGSDAIVVAGTTGEAPTLTLAEREALYSFTVELVGNRVPVIAGCGSNSTQAAIELTQLAEKCQVDAIMHTTPYYNKPSQEGLYLHYEAVARATSLPVMLYNVPGRTGVHLDVSTVVRLSEISNIVSIKDASGDLDNMTALVSHTPQDFTVYCGDDSLTLPAMSVGADGIVSVASHIIGSDMKQMIHAFTSGQVGSAARIHQSLVPIMDAMFAAPSPAPVKEALNYMNVPVGGVRLPMTPLNDSEREALQHLLHQTLYTSAV